MKKKLLLVLITTLVIILVIPACQSNVQVVPAIVEPAPPHAPELDPVPAPVPTPTTPTPTHTPIQNGKEIILRQYADALPAITVGTKEIIANALAGEYQEGTQVAGISATYEGKGTTSQGIFMYFGPAYQGFYVGVPFDEDVLGFARLRKGDTVVFDGEYDSTEKDLMYRQKLNIVFLDDTRLFLIKR